MDVTKELQDAIDKIIAVQGCIEALANMKENDSLELKLMADVLDDACGQLILVHTELN